MPVRARPAPLSSAACAHLYSTLSVTYDFKRNEEKLCSPVRNSRKTHILRPLLLAR